jgi:hypothetical protein
MNKNINNILNLLIGFLTATMLTGCSHYDSMSASARSNSKSESSFDARSVYQYPAHAQSTENDNGEYYQQQEMYRPDKAEARIVIPRHEDTDLNEENDNDK